MSPAPEVERCRKIFGREWMRIPARPRPAGSMLLHGNQGKRPE